jgi:hypothetical protein
MNRDRTLDRLAGHPMGVSWQRDWQVVRRIKLVAGTPPERMRCVPGRGEFWRTLAGDYWTPSGVSEDFMRMLTVEVLSDNYGYDALRQSKPIVVDCGANIGVFSRMALDRGAEKIVCCEPSPEMAHCLEANFESEIREGRLALVRKAVWDASETLRFWAVGKENPGAHAVVDRHRAGTPSRRSAPSTH